jgi:hypothetical protein
MIKCKNIAPENWNFISHLNEGPVDSKNKMLSNYSFFALYSCTFKITDA